MRNSAASRSPSSLSLRASAPRTERLTTPAAMPMIATVSKSSISVKPRAIIRLELPGTDVEIGTGSARLSVGAEREHIDLAVHAGAKVLVGIAPRILRHLVEIRLPVRRHGRARRLRRERLQTLLVGRIAAVVEVVELERLHDRGDVMLRGRL